MAETREQSVEERYPKTNEARKKLHAQFEAYGTILPPDAVLVKATEDQLHEYATKLDEAGKDLVYSTANLLRCTYLEMPITVDILFKCAELTALTAKMIAESKASVEEVFLRNEIMTQSERK